MLTLNELVMKATEVKSQLIEQAIHHLEGLVLELKDEVKNKLRGEGSTDEGGFSGTMGDYSAQSNENFLKEQALVRRKEVEKHERTIQFFKRLNPNIETSEVSLMSLVETDKGSFFISHAIRPIQLHGITYRFLGTDAPIYKLMAGKKAGDAFNFREISYQINSVG